MYFNLVADAFRRGNDLFIPDSVFFIEHHPDSLFIAGGYFLECMYLQRIPAGNTSMRNS